MKVLSDKEVQRLFGWFTQQRLDVDSPLCIEIANLTLTFDRDSRIDLRQVDKGFIRAGHRFLVRLSKTYKVHTFGWLSLESCSISSRSKELVGEHIHVLLCMKSENIIPLLTQADLSPLWKYSKKEQICIQAWDGKPDLLQYNYGSFPDHFHNVIPATHYHPRSSKCRKGSCALCKSFPKLEEILL